MTFSEKISTLSSEIEQKIAPLLTPKCVLLDVPYYTNVGDLLIWEGTETFLRKQGIKILQRCSLETFRFPTLAEDVTILLQGGGNFGDIWRRNQDFRLRVIDTYPNHRIVILPQSICYNDPKVMISDAQCMARHRDLHICARDTDSLQILQQYFSETHSLLTPDMAFCIPCSRLKCDLHFSYNRNLFLRRTDVEFVDTDYSKYLPEQVEIHDWPPMETFPMSMLVMRILLKLRLYHFADSWSSIFRKNLISGGLRFLASYNHIYTTRLHVAILSVLMHKPIVLFDNSYGKLGALYHTWLSDCEGIKYIKPLSEE